MRNLHQIKAARERAKRDRDRAIKEQKLAARERARKERELVVKAMKAAAKEQRRTWSLADASADADALRAKAAYERAPRRGAEDDRRARRAERTAPSAYWREELETIDYMIDASPLILRKLRHHAFHITGIRPYDYRSKGDNRREYFEARLQALRALGGDDLLVPESLALGGFGFDIGGRLFNVDTLKFYEVLIGMERGGVLPHCVSASVRWSAKSARGGAVSPFSSERSFRIRRTSSSTSPSCSSTRRRISGRCFQTRGWRSSGLVGTRLMCTTPISCSCRRRSLAATRSASPISW
jgi:hypothetical protein